MIEAVKSAWALFLGLGFIMLGNGLQGSLVAIRAQFEVFDNNIIGTVMAGYFVGFFAGSILVPKLVASVGHVGCSARWPRSPRSACWFIRSSSTLMSGSPCAF